MPSADRPTTLLASSTSGCVGASCEAAAGTAALDDRASPLLPKASLTKSRAPLQAPGKWIQLWEPKEPQPSCNASAMNFLRFKLAAHLAVSPAACTMSSETAMLLAACHACWVLTCCRSLPLLAAYTCTNKAVAAQPGSTGYDCQGVPASHRMQHHQTEAPYCTTSVSVQAEVPSWCIIRS